MICSPVFLRESTENGREQSLPLADFSYRKNQQKLSAASRLPLGGKVPSESEANEGRDMLSQEESKDSEPREDLTSSVNSVDSFPEGEAEDFGEKVPPPKKRKPGIRKDSKKQAYGKRKYLQRKTEYFRSAYAG